MGTSSITITALDAVQQLLRGTGLTATITPPVGVLRDIPSLQLAAVEFYASQTNDFATATYIGEGNLSFTHAGVQNAESWFYWAKARARNGNYGAVFPASPTAGVQGIALTQGVALVNGQVTAIQSGAGQITVAIKRLDGSDPSSDNPVACQFQTASGLFYFGKITGPKSQVWDINFLLQSGSGYPTMGSGVPFQVWVSAHANSNGTFEMAFSLCATQQIIGDYFQRASATFTPLGNNPAGVKCGGATGVSSTTNARTIARLAWSNGLSTNPFVSPSWVPPDLIALTGTGSLFPGDIVQAPLPGTAGSGSSGTTILNPNTSPNWGQGDFWVTVDTLFATPAPYNFIETDLLTSFSYSVAANITVAMFYVGSGDPVNSVSVGAPANTLMLMRLYDYRQLGTTAYTGIRYRVGGDVAGTWRNGTTATFSNNFSFGRVFRQREIMY